MTYRTINPATGETVRTFGEISDADLDSAVEVARSCYQDDWRHRPVADRARRCGPQALDPRPDRYHCQQRHRNI